MANSAYNMLAVIELAQLLAGALDEKFHVSNFKNGESEKNEKKNDEEKNLNNVDDEERNKKN